MKAWPFLISASVARDYGMVVIPDFANVQGVRGLILQADSGLRHKVGEAIHYKGQHPDGGTLDMLFRVVPAMNDMTGGDGSRPLLDGFGRAIRLIEGFVLRESPPDITITSEHLDQVHEQIKPHFKAFWESDATALWQPAEASHSELGAIDGKPLQLIEKAAAVVSKTPEALTKDSVVSGSGKSKPPQGSDPVITPFDVTGTRKRQDIIIFASLAAVAIGAVAYGTYRWLNRRKEKETAENGTSYHVDRLKNEHHPYSYRNR